MANQNHKQTFQNILTVLHSTKRGKSISFNQIAELNKQHNYTVDGWLEFINAILADPPKVVIDMKHREVRGK